MKTQLLPLIVSKYISQGQVLVVCLTSFHIGKYLVIAFRAMYNANHHYDILMLSLFSNKLLVIIIFFLTMFIGNCRYRLFLRNDAHEKEEVVDRVLR